ncbi:unnamed protein product, partial [Rotaria magnacalcarata]
YRLLNRALRTQDIDMIGKLGFYITNLHKQLLNLHIKGTQMSHVVYRGQSIFRIGEIALLDNGVWNVKLILTHHDDADLRRLMTVISRDVEGSTGLYRLGLLMAKMGEWDKAKDVYELLAEKTSDDENSMPASLHHQLGVIYYQKADLQNALIHYQKIAQQQFEISLIGCPSSCTKLHKHWYYILQAG